MTTTADLLRLRELARTGAAPVVEFERALLSATLLVHSVDCLVPGFYRMARSGVGHRACGIGVFTTVESAKAACKPDMRVESMPGAELLKTFPGATWHVDSDDGGLTLYPPDVARILGEALPTLPVEANFHTVQILRASAAEGVLAPKLHRAARLEAGATDFYLAAAGQKGTRGPADRLLALADVLPESLDRCMLALAATIAALKVKPRLPLTVGRLTPDAGRLLDLNLAAHPKVAFDGRIGPLRR